MMTEEQVQASLQAIRSPALFVRAEQGLLARQEGLDRRLKLLTSVQLVQVPGGHHCHLDGDTRPVADAVRQFLAHE